MKLLIVFGAGMMGQKIAQKYQDYGYNEMILVTRNRKKAKKKFKELNPENIMKLPRLREDFPDVEADVIIASSQIQPPYAEEIEDFLGEAASRSVVDISAKTLFPEYTDLSMHCEGMKALVDRHNATFESISAAVRNEIALRIEEIF